MALLTPQELIGLLEKKLQEVSEHNWTPSPQDKKDFARYLKWMGSGPGHFEKERSKEIMVHLRERMPEVYFLCSLVVTPTQLGRSSLKDCPTDIRRWWNNLPPSPALTNAFKEALNSGLLPGQQNASPPANASGPGDASPFHSISPLDDLTPGTVVSDSHMPDFDLGYNDSHDMNTNDLNGPSLNFNADYIEYSDIYSEGWNGLFPDFYKDILAPDFYNDDLFAPDFYSSFALSPAHQSSHIPNSQSAPHQSPYGQTPPAQVLPTSNLNELPERGVELWNMGERKQAEEVFVEVVKKSEKELGVRHALTLRSMTSLGHIYWMQNLFSKAEDMFKRVLAASEEVLYLEHPLRLLSQSMLASTFWNQEKFKEAEELGLKVMESSENLLGASHQLTLIIGYNLVWTYWKQGRREKARELGLKVEGSSREWYVDGRLSLIIGGGLPWNCQGARPD